MKKRKKLLSWIAALALALSIFNVPLMGYATDGDEGNSEVATSDIAVHMIPDPDYPDVQESYRADGYTADIANIPEEGQTYTFRLWMGDAAYAPETDGALEWYLEEWHGSIDGASIGDEIATVKANEDGTADVLLKPVICDINVVAAYTPENGETIEYAFNLMTFASQGDGSTSDAVVRMLNPTIEEPDPDVLEDYLEDSGYSIDIPNIPEGGQTYTFRLWMGEEAYDPETDGTLEWSMTPYNEGESIPEGITLKGNDDGTASLTVMPVIADVYIKVSCVDTEGNTVETQPFNFWTNEAGSGDGSTSDADGLAVHMIPDPDNPDDPESYKDGSLSVPVADIPEEGQTYTFRLWMGEEAYDPETDGTLEWSMTPFGEDGSIPEGITLKGNDDGTASLTVMPVIADVYIEANYVNTEGEPVAAQKFNFWTTEESGGSDTQEPCMALYFAYLDSENNVASYGWGDAADCDNGLELFEGDRVALRPVVYDETGEADTVTEVNMSLSENEALLLLKDKQEVIYEAESYDDDGNVIGVETETYECTILTADDVTASDATITITATPEGGEELSLEYPVSSEDLGVYTWSADYENKELISESKTVNLSADIDTTKAGDYWVSSVDNDRGIYGDIEWKIGDEEEAIIEIETDEADGSSIHYKKQGQQTIKAYHNGMEIASFVLNVADIGVQYVGEEWLDDDGIEEYDWSFLDQNSTLSLENGKKYILRAVKGVKYNEETYEIELEEISVDDASFVVGDGDIASVDKKSEKGYWVLTGNNRGNTNITVADNEVTYNKATYNLTITDTVYDDVSKAYYALSRNNAKLIAVTSEWKGVIPATVTVDGDEYSVTEIGQIYLTNDGTMPDSEAAELIKNVKTISIPATVEDMDSYTFDRVTDLETIDVDDSNEAFGDVDGILTRIYQEEIYNEDTEEWEYIPAHSLYLYPVGKTGESYTIPENIKQINYSAFRNNKSLKAIEIHANVTDIGEDAFDLATSLEAINVESGNEKYESSNGVLFDKKYECCGEKLKTLMFYPIAKAGTSYEIPAGVEYIHEYAFDDWEGRAFSRLIIPTSLTHFHGSVFDGLLQYDEDGNAHWGDFSLHIKAKNPAAVEFAKSYSLEIPYTLETTDISKASVTLSKTSVVYTGSAIKPQVTVTLNGETLVKDIDYTVAYTNNINPGTATVTVNGIGYYSGKNSATFAITKPAPTPTPEPDPAVGDESEDKYGDYEVTETKGGKVEVAYTAPVSKNKTTVTIPATTKLEDGTVAKVTSIDDKAFKNNKKIKKVTIGKNVEEIGKEAFSGATKLTTVTIGSKVEKIGNKAFYKATALKKVTVPAKTTTIGSSAFYGCKKLTTATIGKNVKTIGSNAFAKCTALKKVTVPTKTTAIGSNAFSGCTKLTSATIGTNVKSIGSKAFYGAKNLKKITIKSTKLTSAKVGKQAFKGVPAKAKVDVPNKKVKAYKKFFYKKGLNKKTKIS